MFSKQSVKDAVDYSFESIHYITEEIGPRESGMPNERKAQEWLKSQLLDNGWADEAEIEDFRVSRHGLVGFTKIVSLFMLVAVIGAFIARIEKLSTPMLIMGLVLSGLTLLITIMEFLLYVPFVDPLLPRSTSGNVYAVKKPTGEVKRRIVFSGHCDSAYEWTLMMIKPLLMIIVLAGAIVGLLFTIVVFAIYCGQGAFPVWALVVTACFAPFYFALQYMCNFHHVVPGANDNLTGTLAAVSVLKCMKDNGVELENTEVAVVLTGSEEAGLRGAKAWAKAHGAQIKAENFETIFIGLETLRDYEHLAIYTRDLTGTVAHDKDAVALLDRASAACEHPLKHASVFFGASDAAAITRAGLKATCLAGMDPTPADYYHNRKDTADNMDEPTFTLGLEIALKAVELYDSEK